MIVDFKTLASHGELKEAFTGISMKLSMQFLQMSVCRSFEVEEIVPGKCKQVLSHSMALRAAIRVAEVARKRSVFRGVWRSEKGPASGNWV